MLTVLSSLGMFGSQVFILDPTWAGVVWLLVAALLLDFFDISLPRGDSVGVAGALCAAAVIVLGPANAALIAVLAALIAHALRRGAADLSRLTTVLGGRVLAVLAATVVLSAYPASAPAFPLYAVLAAVFLVIELVTCQAVAAIFMRRPFLRLLRGNASAQLPLVAAQWSASVLLLLTYPGMGPWSLIPVVALLLLIRQSYAMFLDIRETYRTTVEVLVEAAESQDVRRVGHADRTAAVARSIAMRMGLSAAEVERISYAALLHDLGELAEASNLESQGARVQVPATEVVRDVEFFDEITPVLAVCEGGGKDARSDDVLLAALVVALSSDIDAECHSEVALAHRRTATDVVSPFVSSSAKARVVSAALRLGYRIPAVS